MRGSVWTTRRRYRTEDITMDQVVFDGARNLLDKLEQEWAPDADDGTGPPDPALRHQIVELLRTRLAEPSSDNPAPSIASSEIAALHRTSHEYLERLAHYFSGEEVSFDDPSQIRAFCERIRRSVMIMVSELRQLLSGRRRFQEEFSMVSSRIADDDIGATRMIRRGDIHGDLGKFLFDWRGEERTRQHAKALETAIDELKHHQMALLSGFRHSLKEGTRAVLEEVSPETIKKETGSGVAKLNPFRHKASWDLYEKRFREIIDEDVGWYQDRFLRAFREGYLEYMWGAKEEKDAGAEQPDGR